MSYYEDESSFTRLVIWLVLIGVCGGIWMVKNCGTGDDERLRATAEMSGFTDVQIGSYSFGCGRDDGICKSFTAKGPRGPVKGSIGCGYVMKGCTVRLEP